MLDRFGLGDDRVLDRIVESAALGAVDHDVAAGRDPGVVAVQAQYFCWASVSGRGVAIVTVKRVLAAGAAAVAQVIVSSVSPTCPLNGVPSLGSQVSVPRLTAVDPGREVQRDRVRCRRRSWRHPQRGGWRRGARGRTAS